MPIHNSNEDSMNGSERTLPEETYKSPAGVKKRKMPPPPHRDSNKEADNRLLDGDFGMPDLGEDETNNKPTLGVLPENGANNKPTLGVLPKEFSFFEDKDQRAIKPAAKRQK